MGKLKENKSINWIDSSGVVATNAYYLRFLFFINYLSLMPLLLEWMKGDEIASSKIGKHFEWMNCVSSVRMFVEQLSICLQNDIFLLCMLF